MDATPDVDYAEAWASSGEDAFPISNAVWDGDAIRWLEGSAGEVRLRTVHLDSGASETTDVPELAGWNTAGLTRRASADLVAVGAPAKTHPTKPS
jgi:hypothetical protein